MYQHETTAYQRGKQKTDKTQQDIRYYHQADNYGSKQPVEKYLQ